MAAKKQNRTKTAQKRMIAALYDSLGVVTPALAAAEIGRSQFYKWMREDEEFKLQVESIGDKALDFAEENLFNQMKDGSTAATIFYLKTKGKKRGYIEKQEIDHSHKGKGLNLIIDIQNDDNSDAEA